ncbi:tripartite tricarboxylate transporter substrate binding protein BugD [Rhizobium leguminosarum]|nr:MULTISPECIES: tripartite tricarboxylate transporter substrate-binding protein [Rhizobium]MBY3206328.1 tripartite tricarboxylate transporter substrate binding protein BugD [Rhizobium laguerreae]MBY3386158.1 tripartite tricarboxylate transporter substrate binding protein BugD [Rhizobium laguerreae]MBY3399819.1 tripartite tricarboxylate transporter substrate binding protein BugD [Rhizobium laguerreae]MBY3406757.1 tripartite tricarboxylate transporter substrate binding protein BugD [Rhizobium la
MEEEMKSLSIIAAFTLSVTSAFAADYPERNIFMVVPYAAGGPTDTIARLTADAMSKAIGQQILVENVAGAGGTIGARRVADSEPDGYTILVHHIGMATAPALYRQLPYKPTEAFEPIGLVSDAAMTVIARNEFPPVTFQELIAYIKQNGTKVTYAHAGIGAASHLCGTLFMATIGTQMTTVPYKGNGPIMTDLIGGQIDMTCDQATNTVGPISQKQVKAYAITGEERADTLPDLPTTTEAGLPEFKLGVWHGLYAPKGTPKEVVDKLTSALQAAVEDASLKERFGQIATMPATKEQATQEALRIKLDTEIKRWDPIIKAAGQFAD